MIRPAADTSWPTDPDAITEAEALAMMPTVEHYIGYWIHVFGADRLPDPMSDGEDVANLARLAAWNGMRAWRRGRGSGLHSFITTAIRRVVIQAITNGAIEHSTGSGRRSCTARRRLGVCGADEFESFAGNHRHRNQQPGRERQLIDSDEVAHLMVTASLTDRERAVLRMRFWESRTLLETSKELDVSKERVRQIQNTALARMREAAEVAA